MIITTERQETKTIRTSVVACDACGIYSAFGSDPEPEWITSHQGRKTFHACSAICVVEIFGGTEARVAAEKSADPATQPQPGGADRGGGEG